MPPENIFSTSQIVSAHPNYSRMRLPCPECLKTCKKLMLHFAVLLQYFCASLSVKSVDSQYIKIASACMTNAWPNHFLLPGSDLFICAIPSFHNHISAHKHGWVNYELGSHLLSRPAIAAIRFLDEGDAAGEARLRRVSVNNDEADGWLRWDLRVLLWPLSCTGDVLLGSKVWWGLRPAPMVAPNAP